jgi:hypothetical protein
LQTSCASAFYEFNAALYSIMSRIRRTEPARRLPGDGMTTDSAATPERFDIGRVITRAFSVIGSNFFSFFVMAAVLSLPILVFTFSAFFAGAAGVHYAPPQPGPAAIGAIFAAAIIGFLIYLVFSSVLQAGITHGTIVTLNGGRASLASCFATGLRHALPLTAIIVLAFLGIMAGAILLIVPGIILALGWSVITPVRVAEHRGILNTLGRSLELTRGHRGAIFLVDIIVTVISLALTLTVQPLAGIGFGAVPGANIPVTYVVASGLMRAVTYMITATMVASVYYELRLIKEGIGPEQMAAVFS